jgi:hypothetical protein
MDIRRKLAVTVAAMALAGQLGATLPVAAASQAQLEAMEALLVEDDLAGLARFVEQNPGLLDQSSPLSEMLVNFLMIYRGSSRLEAFPPVLVADISDTLVRAVRAEIY